MIVQQIQALAIHFHLEQAIDARLALAHQLALLNQPQHLGPRAGGIDEAAGEGLGPGDAAGLEDEVAVRVWGGELAAEDGRHGGLEGGAKVELVEAEEALVGVHDAVVVVHGEHEAAREGVAVDPAIGMYACMLLGYMGNNIICIYI